MKVIIADTYEAMSKQAADGLIELMQLSRKPLLSPASGDTPAGLYKELADRHQQQKLDISNWYFVSLDEWLGMDENSEGSCRDHLNRQLFQPLRVKDEK